MWFLYCLTWVSALVQLIFGIICVVSGVYYLAELVEEYSVLAKKTITAITLGVLLCYCGLSFFENFPLQLLLCGIISHLIHLLILQTFPYVAVTSPIFVTSIILLVIHHYFAFQYFGSVHHLFSEIMAYFTIFLWMVPFILFVSLSTNDYVLPTISNTNVNENDVVTKYFSRKRKRYGLLTFFNYIENSVLLGRNKKTF